MDYLWTSLKQAMMRGWHGLYLAGLRHNYRLIGFYSYHYETIKRFLEIVNRKVGKVRQSPRAAATLRVAVFWPLMGLATLLLYTGQSPFTHRQQTVPGSDAEWGVNWSEPNFAQLNAALPVPAESTSATSTSPTPTPPAAPKPATSGSDRAPKPAAPGSAQTTEPQPKKATASAAPNAQQAVADPVAEAMAQLPPFSPQKPARPAAGETVGGVGWQRDQLTGDWVWQPGVTIAAAELGEPVVAAYAGVVTEVRKERAGTWSVVLAHRSGWQSEYGGLEKVSVEPHAIIAKGSPIGQAPSAAPSILSFTLRQNDTAVDPTKYLQ